MKVFSVSIKNWWRLQQRTRENLNNTLLCFCTILSEHTSKSRSFNQIFLEVGANPLSVLLLMHKLWSPA